MKIKANPFNARINLLLFPCIKTIVKTKKCNTTALHLLKYAVTLSFSHQMCNQIIQNFFHEIITYLLHKYCKKNHNMQYS